MKKKAQISGEVVEIIPKIVFIVALVLAFVLLVKSLIVTSIDIRDLEAEILLNRLLFSPDGIIYKDTETGRYHPGMVDLAEFSKLKNLDDNKKNKLDKRTITYGQENPIIAAKIDIKFEDRMETIFYNKEMFDRWEPRLLPEIEGGSAHVKAFKRQVYVLVKDKEKIIPGTLELFIII